MFWQNHQKKARMTTSEKERSVRKVFPKKPLISLFRGNQQFLNENFCWVFLNELGRNHDYSFSDLYSVIYIYILKPIKKTKELNQVITIKSKLRNKFLKLKI